LEILEIEDWRCRHSEASQARPLGVKIMNQADSNMSSIAAGAMAGTHSAFASEFLQNIAFGLASAAVFRAINANR
jgi:hypothetical protein